jgi:antitoxin ChpS
MGMTDPLQITLERFLARIRADYDVAEALLFGSRARGDAHAESDADLAIVLNAGPADAVRTKLEMADVAFDVMLETGILIQPVPIARREWENLETSPSHRLLRSIREDGCPV